MAVPLPLNEIDLNAPLHPEPHVLAIVDTATTEIRVFEGTFDHFAYPPAWTADGSHIYIGAPFEPKRIYRADLSANALEAVTFRRHAPTPMLDADFLAVGQEALVADGELPCDVLRMADCPLEGGPTPLVR